MKPNTLITPRQAEEAINSRLKRQPAESLPLAQCVRRTLRQNVHAERDQPPFDRVTMDGIAVHSEAIERGIKRFRIQAIQSAGDPALVLESQGYAIEVMTGTSLPAGCDCVIPVEQLQIADGFASLRGAVDGTPYHNVHRRGSDGPQGKLLLEVGTLLRAPEIAVAASAGLSELQVSRQPRIAAISTGDELIDPGGPIAEFQVRRSNVYALTAALKLRGFLQVRDDHISDSETELQVKLAAHLNTNDVLLLSGGVSMGRFDLVPKVLKQLGVEEVFYKIAQRPGMPMWFGIGPHGQAVFGLPGNPVATMVCFVRYVIPALEEAMGTGSRVHEQISLASPVSTRNAMTYFLPIAIEEDRSGRAWANPKPPNGPGDFLALAATDGFVELPPGPDNLQQGFVTNLYRW